MGVRNQGGSFPNGVPLGTPLGFVSVRFDQFHSVSLHNLERWWYFLHGVIHLLRHTNFAIFRPPPPPSPSSSVICAHTPSLPVIYAAPRHLF